MIDRKGIKATAKMRMAQSKPGYLKIMLLYVLAAVAVPQAALTFVGTPTELTEQLYELMYSGIDLDLALQVLQIPAQQIMLQRALNIVVWIYQVVMAFGLTRYCLLLYRGEPSGPADLFTGFSMAGRVIGQQMLMSLIIIGCAIACIVPVTGVVVFAAVVDSIVSTVLVVAAVLVLAVLIIVVMLNFVLAAIALADEPELGAMGAIQYGKNLIRGHRGQYFVLILTFFGWSLLCALPLSAFTVAGSYLGLNLPDWVFTLLTIVLSLPVYLWLTPYMNTTIAGFYDALRGDTARYSTPMGPL